MEKQKILISPSILSADFSRLGDEIRDVEKAGCHMIHVDVMDGHFVPNLTIGAPVVKSIRKVTKLPLDVHLMIDEPIRYVDDFQKAGTDYLTFHVEAAIDVRKTLEAIRVAGMKPGLSVRPQTPIKDLLPYLEFIELILIMSVEPGFGGQSFMPETMNKVRELRKIFKGHISVDGGINAETAKQALVSGADVLVAGTAIFGKADRKAAINDLLASH